MNPWANISYQTITNAVIDQGVLTVTFENGDISSINLRNLLPTYDDQDIKDLTSDRINYTSYAVNIDINSDFKSIPWDKIRVISDKGFSKFLAGKADEQAKLVGVKLKRLRERKNIKAIDLAEMSGVSAQTISRIEKGHQDIGFSTLRRLLAAMGYSLKDLANEEAKLEKELGSDKTFSILLKKLSKAGIDPQFVTKKIIPKQIQSSLIELKEDKPELLLDEAASYLSNIYGWSVNEIWDNSELTLNENIIEKTLFKKSIKSNYNQIKAYVPYAHYLARASVNARKKKEYLPFPETIEDFKQAITTKYQGLDLKSIIEYSWDMGICVIPLDDSGIFHGAAWKIDSGYAIVVKQKKQSHAHWIFDILHELFHVFSHLSDFADTFIEVSEISPITRGEDVREKEANSFANQIIFGGNAEEFAQEVVANAKGKIEFLQNSVIEVAIKRGIRKDSLANYLAYRLAYQGKSWWGSADKLQELDPNPLDIARKIFLNNINMDALEPVDYNLLSTAISK